MKIAVITATAALFGASLATLADAPTGVGSADLSSIPCVVRAFVAGPGNFTPFLQGGLGVLFVQAAEAQVIESNSAQGNVHLACHAQLTAGDYVQGIDFISGAFADGFVATGPESCASLVALGFPNTCRGQGEESVLIIDQDVLPLACLMNSVVSYDWKIVYAPGKGISLICHGYE